MKKIIIELTNVEYLALCRFKGLYYYDGGYDLYMNQPKGWNNYPGLENILIQTLKKVSKKARNKMNKRDKAIQHEFEKIAKNKLKDYR